jgi:hypothetical protein
MLIALAPRNAIIRKSGYIIFEWGHLFTSTLWPGGVSFIQKDKLMNHSYFVLKLVRRPARSGKFFKAFDSKIAVGVAHVMPDARAIEQSH